MRRALALPFALLALTAVVPAAGAFVAQPDPYSGIPAAAISDGHATLVWQVTDGSGALRTLRDDQELVAATALPAPPLGCRPELARAAEILARCDGTTSWNDRFFLVDPATGALSEDHATYALSSNVDEHRANTPLALGSQAVSYAATSFAPGAEGGGTLEVSRATGRLVAVDPPLDSAPDLDQPKGWRWLCPGLHRRTYLDQGTGGAKGETERRAWPGIYRAPWLLERDPASGMLWLRRCGQRGNGKALGNAASLDDVVLRDRYVAIVADGQRTVVIRWLADGRRWIYRRPWFGPGIRLGAATDRRLLLRAADGTVSLLDLGR
jgi:hypothetical protein